MLGLSLAKPEYLSASDIEALAKAYCGVCCDLRKIYGEWAGVLVNYDARFISLLIISQRELNTEISETRCPASVYSLKNKVFHDETLTYASAITMILFEQKLSDNAIDQKDIASKHFSSIANNINAEQTLPQLTKLHFPVSKFEILRDAQVKVESSIGHNIEDYIEPTAEIVAEIFSHTSILSKNFSNQEKLATIGRAVGKIVSLIDACEDLVSDRRKKQFNPILSSLGIKESECISITSLAKICTIIANQFFTIYSVLPSVNFFLYSTVIENILTRGLPERATDALSVLWHENHWSGELPIQLKDQLKTQRCQTCNIYHLPSPIEGKHSPSIWTIATLSPEIGSSYKELGFQSAEFYFLASMLPSFSKKPYKPSWSEFRDKSKRKYI